MDSNKKAEDIFKKDKSFKNGERKSSQHVKYEKKHGSSNRHSYHQQMGGGMLYNGHENIYEVNGDSRSFVTRERSFVRPQSTATLIHSQMKEHQHQKRRSGMVLNPKGKPALEIYRPPTLRSSTFIDANDELFNGKILHSQYDAHGNVFNNNQHSSSVNNHSNNNNNHNNNNNNNNNNNDNGVYHIRNKNSINSDRSRRPGLNIHAKEFVSCQGNQSLHHSMSSSSVNMFHQGKRNLQHSKSGAEIKQEGMISSSKVHFAERKDNDPDAKLGMTNRNMQSKASLESYESTSIHNPIKRSKSLGSVDLRKTVSEETLEPLAKIGPLSKEVQKLLSDAVNDPNKLSARQLMDAVRHIIVRVIETSRYSEPGAQICIRIIQREKGETFLETLLNTCQEYYQERQRLLRNTQNTPYAGGIVSYPRWIAYMSFLNEMYTQLKRRHNQLMTQQMKNNETPPGIHLLTLLAQCCNVCLQESVINSLSETECLFFVLTAVGKDIELKLPQHMARVMCAARDAFLTTVHLPAVRKTLLQLIEMHAARWNLSAPAVMYYYPGCCPTK